MNEVIDPKMGSCSLNGDFGMKWTMNSPKLATIARFKS